MKTILLVLAGFILGATMAAVPLRYKLHQAIEEKNNAVIVASNLLQSEPEAIEAACHQREMSAKTAAIAEITAQHPPLPPPAAPAPVATPAPQTDSILMGLLRLLLR